MTKRLAFLCILAFLLTPHAVPAGETEPRLHALEVIRTDGIQAHMPGTVEDTAEIENEEPPPPEPPPEQHALLDIPDWLVETLLWSIALLGIGSILWSLRDSLPSFQSRPFVALQEAPSEPLAEQKLEAAQDEADGLAQQGRFVDAMHLLLLRALAEMRRRLGVSFADSLTSREVLRQAKLTAAARTPLAEIIGLVEATYFGRRPAAASDYQACRERFETLRDALRKGAAA